MFRSISTALGVMALAIIASAQNCGGLLQGIDSLKAFNVTYRNDLNLTVVTIQGGSIKYLQDPGNIISPCLQMGSSPTNGSVLAQDDTQYGTQYLNISAAFRENRFPGSYPNPNIMIPVQTEVEPLLRVEYIKAISLFYGIAAEKGNYVYGNITANYGSIKAAVSNIPQTHKKRIGWIEYDFTLSRWIIHNNLFTRSIIQDAGGIPFPLPGASVGDVSVLEEPDLQTLILNAWIVIDQTDFRGKENTLNIWRNLTGFQSMGDATVMSQKRVYSLSNTRNSDGISDFYYRSAARPDLLLQDLVRAQYPDTFKFPFTFMDPNFSFGEVSDNVMKKELCGTQVYNDVDIGPYSNLPSTFTGDGTESPPLVGSGIYGGSGNNGSGNGGSGSKSKTPVIVAVVVVAAVLGAGFAFAFFKWGKRAKEDRFIELEDEMNNDIPLN
ncbi:hypothetical protein BGZ83_008854 [Gryganskiella cystojenkinii]|nr:hypothetical protein BGZ83_008854 [Gryganskiella cystojenkinii]